MKKQKIKNLFFIIIFLSTLNISYAQDSSIENKIDSLLAKMTLQEKIGQLVRRTDYDKNSVEMIKEGKIGVMGYYKRSTRDSLQKIAVEQTKLHIPLLFAADVIHGFNTTFPVPLAQSCSWDPDLAEKAASIAAFEASSNGLDWTFDPMIDIARDPRWGRIVEGAGEDPYLGSIMAAAYVRGFQGNNLKDKWTIAATAKHYVAYGAAQAGRDYNTVDISERTLREIYLPPFHAAVNAGVASIMSAFDDLNGVPASANYFTLTKILRDEWKYKGVVISDYNSIGELVNHGIAKNKEDAAREAITAGVDIDLVGDTVVDGVYTQYLETLVKNKIVPESLIDRSVRRVLRMKFRMGIFEHPYVDTAFFKENMPSKKYKNKIALELARESIVLLKNKDHLLPLKNNIHSIALIGPLADDQEDLLGPWSGMGLPENNISVFTGIKNEMPAGVKINYAKGCGILDTSRSGFDDAVKAVENSDVAILVVGESRKMSGEAASRAKLCLPGIQEELVEKLTEIGKPVVVVLMNGRPLTIDWISQNVPAVLETWFLGCQGGNAIADVLFGKYNPSGKLTTTFPRSVGQVPLFYNHMNTGRPPKKDERYSSKYLDMPFTPLYPFGYGLSYTTFKFSNIKVDKSKMSKNDSLVVSVEIKNTGSFAGTEIAQLYIRDLVASVTRPVKELKGFKRVFLNPNEEKTIMFKITPGMLEFYNINMHKTIEPGKFNVMIGGSSEDVISTSFKVSE